MELKLGLKDRKFINNLPKFEDGKTFWQSPSVSNTTSPQVSRPLVLPVQNQGWSYSAAAKVNTNDFKLNNPTGPKIEDTNVSAAQAAAGAGPWFALGAWLGGGVVQGLNSVLKSGELLAQAGTSNGSYSGIGYTKLNTLDASGLMDEYKKDTNNAWFTNPAKAITQTLFGKKSQEYEIAKANLIAKNINLFNMAGAATQALQLDNLKKEGDYNNQVLYAKNGKLPGFKDGFDGRARISNGEIYGHINPVTGEAIDAWVAGHGHDKKDSLIRNLGNTKLEFNTAYVLPEKYAKLVRNGMDVNTAIDMFSNGINPNSFKCGKMPGFKNGWYNYIPYGINTLTGLGQLDYFMRLKPKYIDTYAENPYEKSALNDLAGLRVNQYPMMNSILQSRAEANYDVDNSGGLGGGQRARLKAANLATTQRSIYDMMFGIQRLNNEYTGQLANAKMNLGSQLAQRRQQSKQFGRQEYMLQNSAYNKNLMTSLANISNIIGQGFKAYNTDRLNDKLINMWNLDLDERQLALLQKIRKGERV